jgi:hypothetical protein
MTSEKLQNRILQKKAKGRQEEANLGTLNEYGGVKSEGA